MEIWDCGQGVISFGATSTSEASGVIVVSYLVCPSPQTAAMCAMSLATQICHALPPWTADHISAVKNPSNKWIKYNGIDVNSMFESSCAAKDEVGITSLYDEL